MFSSWSRTQKSTLRRAAGGLATSRTEDLATRHCIKPASDATCLLKLTTTFLLATHLSPELKYVRYSSSAGYYQDYSPRAFQVRSGIFRDVLRGISPPGRTGSATVWRCVAPLLAQMRSGDRIEQCRLSGVTRRTFA